MTRHWPKLHYALKGKAQKDKSYNIFAIYTCLHVSKTKKHIH